MEERKYLIEAYRITNTMLLLLELEDPVCGQLLALPRQVSTPHVYPSSSQLEVTP
jgi:hypothetical protein